MPRKPTSLALGIGAAALIVASLVAWTRTSPDASDHASSSRTPNSERDGSKHRASESARSPESERIDRDRAHDAQPRAQQEAERRRQTRELLQRKYGRTPDSTAPPDGDTEPEPLADPQQPTELSPSAWSLPEEYVQGVLEDQLIPAAKSCYEDIAPPGTSGELTFSVAVIGDPELGGIIDEVSLKADESSIEGELSECIRQASYALEFDPPESGRGVEEFDFTMRFDSDEEPG
jgi:hypothetical protein